jgi:hypothetical protein
MNMVKSIRKFFYDIDNTVKWYVDEFNADMVDDEFVEVLSSTRIREDEILPEVSDLINVNVYSKADVDALVGKIYDALNNRFIDVLDFENGTLTRLDRIYITRIEITNLGNISGYQVKNLSVFIEYLSDI